LKKSACAVLRRRVFRPTMGRASLSPTAAFTLRCAQDKDPLGGSPASCRSQAPADALRLCSRIVSATAAVSMRMASDSRAKGRPTVPRVDTIGQERWCVGGVEWVLRSAPLAEIAEPAGGPDSVVTVLAGRRADCGGVMPLNCRDRGHGASADVRSSGS
jgi:hypothetical protein